MCHFQFGMKVAKRPELHNLEKQTEHLLREVLGRVPSFKLVSVKYDVQISSDSGIRVDALARIKAGKRSWMLAVETKRNGQPQEVRSATLQLANSLRQIPGVSPRYGILLAPFISAESAKLCSEAGIGYADLAGNTRLAFDRIYIETRSAENPYRERREFRSLFAARAARVVRVLLQGPLRPWKVVELAETAQVSLGWVSAVRQQLLAREWAAEKPAGIQVTKPGLVLDAWAKADDWAKRTDVREYSVLTGGAGALQLAGKLQEATESSSPVFTQWFAGWLRHPYTEPTVVTAYVKSFPDEALIQEKLLGRRVPAGQGGLRLALPKDEGVLHLVQNVRGFKLVSDVQIYLDLQGAGLRGEDQAGELRRWQDFAGGWA